MKRQYQCRRCGELGHNMATCARRHHPQPVTDRPTTAYERARPILGTMPDTDVASIIGCAVSTVAAWRRKLCIPRPKKVPTLRDIDVRYPGMSARLGVEPDSVIALDYGISRERVRQIRSQQGIARPGGKDHTLPPDALELLGRTPDTHIADFYDVPLWFVQRERSGRGIAAATSDQHYDRIINLARDRVGKVSDRDIADELDIPVAQVVSYRRRNSIPPFRLSPRCEGVVPLDRATIAPMCHDGATDGEIAAAVGSSAVVVAQIRSTELRLLRRPANLRITPEQTNDVLRLSAEGKTPWSISKVMGISHQTVMKIVHKNRGG